VTFGTRAVYRRIPMPRPRCAACRKTVSDFTTGKKACVIANVYEGDRWDRVETFHSFCYEKAQRPYGEPTESTKGRGHRIPQAAPTGRKG
jgi:hypothetical protein